MFLRQLYNQPLAQASYLIGCQLTGEAIVIDPLRDIAPYLELAASEGLRITHVTETHIHADFVSGVRELAAATGAKVFLSGEGGEDWQYRSASKDGATLIHDGDVILVGNLRFDVLHTPGHTPEHLSFVLTDKPSAAGPMGIITGDFVFVGDVGRPDLLERAAGVSNTMEAGARTLFHSLERFRALPDYYQVWPGHGAGSACGKALGAVPSSTVGYEKRANWGVAETDEQRFVEGVLEGQPEPPRYFAQMKRINREGPPVLGIGASLKRLAPERVVALSAQTWLIDLRPSADFARGHLPGALCLPYSRSFSTYAGSLVPYDVDLVFVAASSGEPDTIHDATPDVVRMAAHDLSLIGLDRVVGWLDANAAQLAWTQAGHELARLPQMSIAELQTWSGDALTVIDVRGQSEWSAGHLPGAMHIPLGALADRLAELPATTLVLQCQSGSRSAVAASLLQRLGRDDVFNLTGGYAAWQRSQGSFSLSAIA